MRQVWRGGGSGCIGMRSVRGSRQAHPLRRARMAAPLAAKEEATSMRLAAAFPRCCFIRRMPARCMRAGAEDTMTSEQTVIIIAPQTELKTMVISDPVPQQ